MSRRRFRQNTLNLDALTDIIANCIGVLLFLLLFAVLSSRTTFYNFYVPSSMNPDDAVRAYVPIAQDTVKLRTSFLCSDGILTKFDLTDLFNRLTIGLPEMTYENFENVVAMMNNRTVSSSGLTATMVATVDLSVQGGKRSKRYGELKMIINKRQSGFGESLDMAVMENSQFYRNLESLDPEIHWVCFYVENDSLEMFRRVREIAWDMNFDVGWEPSVVSWPQVIDLKNRSGGSRSWDITPNLNQGS